MLAQDELTGKWSAYAYDGYGIMEDELVAFQPDGTGWFAFERHVLCEHETFTWSISADNYLTIKGVTYRGIGNNQSGVAQQPSGLLLNSLHFAIEDKPVKWPGGEVKTTLTFDKAPFAGAKTFARIATAPEDLKPPLFEGEAEVEIKK